MEEKLVELYTDICKRNGKTKLLWLGDKTKTLNYTPKSDEIVLTVHRWFASKSCPGSWMYAHMGNFAEKVTVQLGGMAKNAGTCRTYTVAQGDTLWTIAKKHLSSGSRYKEIVSLNGLKSNVLYSGMKLKIPNK